MVLLSVLGCWELRDKVGFVEEEVNGDLSILFFSFWDLFLRPRIAASKASGCLSSQVLLL